MARRAKKPVVLTIAGFDPSSGAGVTADLQTLAAHGCFGVACITALTIQSTAGVRSVHPVDSRIVARTLAELAADLPIAAVKVGMLGSADVIDVVAGFLRRHRPKHVVLDPILKSSSGARLLPRTAVDKLKRKLLPLCSVITPNVDEATALTGFDAAGADRYRALRSLHDLGVPVVVLTGASLTKLDIPGLILDHVSMAVGRGREMAYGMAEIVGPRIKSRSTHGTGCAHSTAIAANLAKGMNVVDAARAAHQFVTRAIETAQPLGRGHGPMNLLWPLNL
jgi:hydroxymethylpyrimidine/phosphomethylpyrimidine kinase